MKILYICSSQFSGSTLISFLLNCHASAATIGHTTGWQYSNEEDFRCSCDNKLRDCPLFTEVEKVFQSNGITYNPQNFGTAFRLSENARINQLLIDSIPYLKWSFIEHLRDRLVRTIPAYRKTLQKQLRANQLLMQTVVSFLGASLYLDNSHSPYRMRILSQDPGFTVYPIHLIRDPRGVCLSLMTNSGFNVIDAIESWLKNQVNIFRIANEIHKPLVVSYESLCRDTDQELSKIHSFVGIEHQPFDGDFKNQEHHILGNSMRLTSGTINLDERWKRDLSSENLQVIEEHIRGFQKSNPSHPLTSILNSYLSD